MNFNERLLNLRISKGLSQLELSEILQVSEETIYKWEIGESYPEFEKLIQLSIFYSISLDELIIGVSTENTTKKQINEIYNLTYLINTFMNGKEVQSFKQIFSGYCIVVYWAFVITFVLLLIKLTITFLG